MAKELDIIIFGATGYTGKNAIPIIFELLNASQHNFTWGVAGRSADTLKATLAVLEGKLGSSLKDIPIIIANCDDEESLSKMAQKARIIVNCVGPYKFYGEKVVKACLGERTHYVDVNAEPNHFESLLEKYGDEAHEKEVYIVCSCGLDSLPFELGVVFLQEKFSGQLSYVETFLQLIEGEPSRPGSSINYGTWQSLVYSVSSMGNTFVKKVFNYYTSKSIRNTTLRPKLFHRKPEVIDGWILPCPTIDLSLITHTQQFFQKKYNQTSVPVETYYVPTNFLQIIGALICFTLIFFFSKFKCGKYLLLKHPKLFSMGKFRDQSQSPDEQKMAKSSFIYNAYGKGWKDGMDAGRQKKPNADMCITVKGINPYKTTNYALILSAITILTEPDKLPEQGGVWTPGYAFAKTSLREKLHENGVTFEVKFQKNLTVSK